MTEVRRFLSRAPVAVCALLLAVAVVFAFAMRAIAGSGTVTPPPGQPTSGKTIGSGGNSVVANNRMYTMGGIQYWFYTDEGLGTRAKTSDGTTNAVVTLNATGEGNTIEMIPDTYWAQENQNSTWGTGFKYNSGKYRVVIKSDDTEDDPVRVPAVDDPYFVTMNLSKYGVNYNKTPRGDASLGDAVYEVLYFDQKLTQDQAVARMNNNADNGGPLKRWYFKTDEGGNINFSTAPTQGTVQTFNPTTGTKTSTSYSSHSLYTSGNNRYFLLGTYLVTEVAPSEGHKIPTSAADYRRHVTFKADSAADVANLTTTFSMPQPEMFGGIKLYKEDYKTGVDPRGDTNMEATFAIVNRSKKSVRYNKAGDYAVGQEVTRIKATRQADGRWMAATGEFSLDYGTYEVYECSAPEGHYLDDGYHGTVTIHTEGWHEIVADRHPVNKPEYDGGDVEDVNTDDFTNHTMRGGIRLRKTDALTGDKPNGDMDLEATFAIVNSSKNFVLFKGDKSRRYAVGDVVTTITTSKQGNGQWWASTGEHDLDYGTYEVFEIEPAEGHLEGKTTVTFNGKTYQAVADGKYVEKIVVHDDQMHTATHVWLNEPKYNGLKLLKTDYNERFVTRSDLNDIDLGEGDGTLLGAEFTITNHSKNPVYVGPIHGARFNPVTNKGNADVENPDNWVPVGGDVMTIKVKMVENDQVVLEYMPTRTGKRAVASTEPLSDGTAGNERLPYGTYNIKETLAPEGYNLTYGGEFWWMRPGEHNALHDNRKWYMVDGRDLMNYITRIVQNDIVEPAYQDHENPISDDVTPSNEWFAPEH